MCTNKFNKIIFLDIDGVLNGSQYASDLYYDIQKTDSRLISKNVLLFSEPIKALQYILKSVDNLGIIWTTDWRGFSQDNFNGWLNPVKWLSEQDWFKPYICGITPRKLTSERADEIKMWLSENTRFKNENKTNNIYGYPLTIKNFIIIDDLNSNGLFDFKSHFVWTDYSTGLTLLQAKRVVEFLNEPLQRKVL